MEFSILLGPAFPGHAVMTSDEAYALAMAMAEMAEAVGFDGIGINHHWAYGPNAQTLPPFQMLAAVSARWPHLHTATTVFLLPLHDPVTTAEQTALLDVMSGGRFSFGVGQGYRQAEFDALGVLKADRSARLVECIKAMKALWSGTDVSFDGEFFHFEGLTLGTKPHRPGGPPVLLGADRAKTVDQVPTRGDGWLISPRHSLEFLRENMPVYKEALVRAGKEYDGLFLIRELATGATTDVAEQSVRAAIEATYQSYSKARETASGGPTGESYGSSFEEVRRDRLLFGSSDEIVEQILAYNDEFGVRVMAFRVYWPGMEPDQVRNTIKQVGEEVLPAVRDALRLVSPVNER